MKRFLILVLLLLLIIVIGLYLYYIQGYYIGFAKQPSISTPFHVNKDVIYHRQGDTSQPFVIRGVEIDSSYGPKRGTDFTIDEATWMRWFELIQQLGANTIRASIVLDDTFYTALYHYNKSNEHPLFLLQGMQVTTDEMILKTKDNHNPKFFQSLKKDGKALVDIIHGRKIVLASKHKGNGFYRKDISPWVIGYLIGDEWNQDSIAYINKTLQYDPIFNGKYVTTTSEATNFEMMMAQLIDHIVGYESRKYHTQRLVSVNSLFAMDPFRYEEHYAAQLGKFNTFTMDHINPTSHMESGLFASYAYEEINLPLIEMMETSDIVNVSNGSSYVDLLYQVHKMPVIISSVGHPSSGYLNLTDKQETSLLNDLRQFDIIGYNGVIIRSWQDVWDRRSVETSYAVDLQQISEWHDPLTPQQHFGLLGFKPYRDEQLMKVDGENDDWQDVSVVFEDTTRKVLMTRDHAYMYFWIEDPLITEEGPFYLALDLHPELGSSSPNLIDAKFDRKIDFLIEVDSKQGAQVFVQDRYQSVRHNFLEYVTGENPYVTYPEKDSDTFETVKYLKEEKRVFTEEMEDASTPHFRYTFKEVSHLVASSDIEEREIDVSVKEGRLEIRVPYQLLNIYDPLKFTIHDDYHQYFGVEPLSVNKIYLSIVDHTKSTQSIEIPVQRLGSLEYVKEYLKPAYYVVQNYWKESD